MAGLKVKSEVANVLVLGPPGIRADLVASIPDGTKQIIIDVRTAEPCTAENVKRSAEVPGHAACQAEILKNRKWGDYVNAQGDLFVGFAVEAGGALGDGARSLLDLAACANGSSTAEIAAFIEYALQRIHITTQLGVARTNSSKHADPNWCPSSSFTGCSRLGECPPQVPYLPATCPEAFQQDFDPTAAISKTCSTNYGSNNHNYASSLSVCPAPHPSQHNCSPLTG